MLFWLLPLAVLYAVAFIVVGIKRPRYALAGIFAAAPFQNDLSIGGPVRFSLAEINLLLSIPVMVFYLYRLRVGPTFLPAMGYILACLASLVIGVSSSALTSIVQTLLYLVVVVVVFATLGADESDYRLALNSYLCVCFFMAALICVHRTGFVLGLHKNGVGASLAAGCIIALELSLATPNPAGRIRYLVTLAVLFVAMIVTLSRGAWLATISGTMVIFALRREFKLLARCVFVLVPVGLLAWQLLNGEGRSYAFGFDRDNDNVRLRLESMQFAMTKFESSPLLGAGIGLRKEYDATNLPLLLLAETGILGAAAFALLHLVAAVAIITYSLRIPRKSLSFSIVVLAGALVFGKVAHGMVDHYWSRGSLSASWASLGMAVRVSAFRRGRRPTTISIVSDQSLELPPSGFPGPAALETGVGSI